MSLNELIGNSSFSMLEGKIDSRILDALKQMGITKPTRVQAETFPHLLMQLDLIGAAKTGSGKTLAFLIPVIENVLNWRHKKSPGPSAVILSPTRELAMQTFKVLERLLSSIPVMCACLLVGGEKKSRDLAQLELKPNIIVSTPGRLLDHLLNTESFTCKSLKCLVLDEADKLLDIGFEKHIRAIIQHLPVNRQTIMFSATIDQSVKSLAKLALKRFPILIKVKDPADDEARSTTATVSGLKQGYSICPVENRMQWLYKMLKKSKKLKVIVFFSSCKSVDFHHEFFRLHCKANVLSIHGQLSQARRKEAYNSFVSAKEGALFCTDVAARGLDIPKVDWIVQYDPPSDPKEYIHRVGRTARGENSTGNAVIVLRPEEEHFVEYLNKENVQLDKYTIFGDFRSNVQEMLEKLIQQNGVMKLLARKAYLAYLRSYNSHPLKKVFNTKSLDLKLAAKAFGFLEQPDVDFRVSDAVPTCVQIIKNLPNRRLRDRRNEDSSESIWNINLCDRMGTFALTRVMRNIG